MAELDVRAADLDARATDAPRAHSGSRQEHPSARAKSPAGAKASSGAKAKADKPAVWRRWIAIVLRCAHIAGIVLLGAALHGAPMGASVGAALTLASGLGLFIAELADTRIRVNELAGVVVIAKLVAVALMGLDNAAAPVLFWLVLAVSGLMSHAPRDLRHWRPGR